jgi:hypothetical protein
MNKKLTPDELQTRLQTILKDSYNFIFSVMKGASVANALIISYSFFTGKEAFSWMLGIYWIISFIAMILTFQSTVVGLIAVNFPLDWRDGIFPFLLSVCEFSMFSTLQSDTSSQYWFAVFGVYILIAGIIAYNVGKRINPDDYDGSLKKFAGDWKKSTIFDSILALFLAGFSIVWAMLRSWSLDGGFYQTGSSILSVIFLCVLIQAIRSQQNKLREAYTMSYLITSVKNPPPSK